MVPSFPLTYEAAVVLTCLLTGLLMIICAVYHRLGWYTGLVMAGLSCVLCMLCARGYYLLVAGVGYSFELFPKEPYDYAFGGGVLGFLAALWLTSVITRRKRTEIAEVFAPIGLLAIACMRLAEALSDFGWGDMLEVAWLQRYPFAIENMYGEWCAAVFNLEAACALGVLVVVLCRFSKGHRLLTGLCWWSVTQIFCESLRVESIVWGFVRVQQLQCALILLAILLICTFRLPREGRKRSLVPWSLFLAGCGAVIFLEYALDKMPWYSWINYVAMVIVLVLMGLAVHSMIRADVRERVCL